MASLFERILSIFFGPSASRDLSSNSGTRYVRVEDDGGAWELEADEIEYLNTEFHGADGGRPYIKATYRQRTPDGRLNGYLDRRLLPPSIRVKPISEATPVTTAEEAISIAQKGLPLSTCIRSGTTLRRVVDKRSGEVVFGVPDVNVASGVFSATRADGLWRVTRQPATEIEQACYADISAASGRIMAFGWF